MIWHPYFNFDPNSCCDNGGGGVSESDSFVCLCDDLDGTQTPYLLRISNDGEGNRTETPVELDGSTPYTVLGTTVKCSNLQLEVAYIETCDQFDVVLPIDQLATFSDNVGPENTISSSVAGLIRLLQSEIEKAQLFEEQEVANGLPITQFTITTDDGSVYAFNPSALTGVATGTLTIDQTLVSAWGPEQAIDIADAEYSIFSNCGCRAIEMVQQIGSDGQSTLIALLDPRNTDFSTGEKPLITLPPPFGVFGPNPGPCPEGVQVLALDALCCNNDLINNDTENVTPSIIAWLDAATDVSNLLDGGGIPIAGLGGERVEEILNPLGVGPSWDGQGPNGGAHYELDQQNGLPGLVFDGGIGPNAGDHYELVTGEAQGNPFQVFMLLRVTEVSTVILGQNLGGGGDDSWQIQSNGPDVYFRYRPTTTNPLTDINFATFDEFADGNIHLLTITYSGDVTNDVQVYLDGQLRADFNTVVETGGQPVSLHSGRVGIMRNALDENYPAGIVFEAIYTNQLLTANQTSAVNAYIICKWGIDASLAIGGAGDLTLAENGTYGTPSQFRRIMRADGTVIFLDLNTGLEFPVPPIPGLSVCASSLTDPVGANINVLSETFTNAGSTLGGAQKVSALNNGIVDVTFNGDTLAPGESETFEAYFDPALNEYRRLNPIDYDATGGSIKISTTP